MFEKMVHRNISEIEIKICTSHRRRYINSELRQCEDNNQI